MRTSKISDFIFIIYAATNILFFTSVTFYDALTAVIYPFNVLCITCMLVFRRRLNANDKHGFLFVCVFCVYLLLTFPMRGTINLGITFLVGIITYIAIADTEFPPMTYKALFIFFTAQFAYWCASSYRYFDKFMIKAAAGIHVFNSNTVATILLMSGIGVAALLELTKLKHKPPVRLAIYALCFWNIFQTQSRASLLAVAFYLIFDICIPKKVISQKQFLVFLSIVVILGSLLVPLAYVLISESVDRVDVVGKNLFSGRQNVWADLFNIFDDDYSRLIWGSGPISEDFDLKALDRNASNPHSNSLAIVYNFGIAGFCLFFGFITHQISKICKTRANPMQIRLVLGFLAMLINGYFENYLIWGNMLFYSYIMLALAMNISIYKVERTNDYV